MAKPKVKFKTWEEFCEQTGTDPNDFGGEVTPRSIARFKLEAMILYCNGGELPDHTDSSVVKYEPWWRIVKDDSKPSGRGLSVDVCGYWYTVTHVGPRLCFLAVAHLQHITKHFLALYELLML